MTAVKQSGFVLDKTIGTCEHPRTGDDLRQRERGSQFHIYLLLCFLYSTHSWARAGVNQVERRSILSDLVEACPEKYHVRLAVMIMEYLLISNRSKPIDCKSLRHVHKAKAQTSGMNATTSCLLPSF